MTETLVIRVDPARREWWKSTLTSLLPQYKVVLWDEDEYEPRDVVVAVVWNPPLGGLAQMPNLRCVASVGAGVSHILKDPSYPRTVPIIRTTSESLRNRMTEYVVMHVLRLHRKLHLAEEASARGEWVEYIEPLASDLQVGLLGVGNLGRAAAAGLRAIGYEVSGWSRQGRPVEGVRVFSGRSGLTELLGRADFVVSMLPLTPETRDLLNRDFFEAMKTGASLINVGRGEHVVDEDLIRALDSGQLAYATLDVFREEPLPAGDPLWKHPRILLTAHTASAIGPQIGGQVIAPNITRFMNGEHLDDLVDLQQGY